MPADRKTLRKRERNAADVLMNNTALRENLTDVQAELALNWSFDQIAALVDQTADLADKKAESEIDDLVARLQENLKQVNLLTGSMPGCKDKLAATRDYQVFLKTLYGKKVPYVAESMMKDFVAEANKYSVEETFSHFFAIVQKELTAESA
ncbi:MAG: hypothetical protein AAF902_19465 [Chloroflexota bacterium]